MVLNNMPTHRKTHVDMNEGAAAFERFRSAMKMIVSVPKSAVVAAMPKVRRRKKKTASRKG